MIDKINGRTPEEIKRGLECCVVEYKICDECPFADVYLCEEKLRDCAIILIKQLQENNKQLERERDEARNDLDTISYANTELHGAYEAMKHERDAAGGA